MSSQKIVVYLARTSELEWRKRIEKLEVDRLTDKSFWVNDRRCFRKTEDAIVCDTLEEAKQTVLDAMRTFVDRIKQRLEKAEAVIQQMVEFDDESVTTSTSRY